MTAAAKIVFLKIFGGEQVQEFFGGGAKNGDICLRNYISQNDSCQKWCLIDFFGERGGG